MKQYFQHFNEHVMLCFNRLLGTIVHSNGPYAPQVRGCSSFLTELFALVSFSLLVCAVAVLVQYCMSMLIDCNLFFSALGCLHPAASSTARPNLTAPGSVCACVCVCVCALTWEGLNGVVACSVVRTCGCDSIRVCVCVCDRDSEIRQVRSDEEILGLHSPRALPVVLATAEERIRWRGV